MLFKLPCHNDGILPGMLIVILAPSHAPEAPAAVQGDGGVVGGPDFQRQKRQMVGLQLRQTSPHQQDTYPRVPQRQQLGLAPHGPAFAAAARSAVGRVPCAGKKKFTLPRIRRAVKDKFHAFGASFRL